MKKCMIVISVLMSLLLAGCGSWLSGSYASVTPHEEYYDGQHQEAMEASNEEQLRQILTQQVTNGSENCIIYAVELEEKKLPAAMDGAIRTVTEKDPIGAFAVESITYEVGTSTGRTAIAVQIDYKRSRSEILRIKHTNDMDETMSVIAESLQDCDAGVVIQVEQYENIDITQRIQDYVDAHPEDCMEMPQVSVAAYPDRGKVRVIELTFTYQNSRDALRSMQYYVQPVFRAAVLNVSGEEGENVKFSRMYAFLMERNDYQQETSITPAYSLLRHGVGDSKAFATVYAAMCRSANLQCQVITGTRDGEPWTWNLICEDGIYYHVDLLHSIMGGRMERLYQEDMEGYVWDYSAYPVAEAPEPVVVVTEPTGSTTEAAEEQPTETVITNE